MGFGIALLGNTAGTGRVPVSIACRHAGLSTIKYLLAKRYITVVI